MIDQQAGIFNFGEGISGFAQRRIEIEALFHDPVTVERVAALDAKSRSQRLEIRGGIERAQVDCAELEPGARENVEPHDGSRIGFCVSRPDPADRADHLRIIIAVDTQQADEQFLIGPEFLNGVPRAE